MKPFSFLFFLFTAQWINVDRMWKGDFVVVMITSESSSSERNRIEMKKKSIKKETYTESSRKPLKNRIILSHHWLRNRNPHQHLPSTFMWRVEYKKIVLTFYYYIRIHVHHKKIYLCLFSSYHYLFHIYISFYFILLSDYSDGIAQRTILCLRIRKWKWIVHLPKNST